MTKFPFISLTECNSCTIQKLPFDVNCTVELKNIATTSDNSGIWRVVFCLRIVPVLSDVVDILMSSVVVLTSNGNFLFVSLLYSVSDVS